MKSTLLRTGEAPGAAPSRLANPTEHDDLLNYRLKRLVSISGAPAIRLCEGRYGVTRQEWRVLAALVESGPMAPSMLAERAMIVRAAASRRVTALVAKRLVQRVVRVGDARFAELSATAAGHHLYAELFPQLAAINRRLMAALDDQEALQLATLLDKLTAHARRIQAEGDGVDARADRRHGGSRRHWPLAAGGAHG